MFCEKCNYGSDSMKHSGTNFKCPTCGNKTFITKNPFPKNRTTSIHPKKEKLTESEKTAIIK